MEVGFKPLSAAAAANVVIITVTAVASLAEVRGCGCLPLLLATLLAYSISLLLASIITVVVANMSSSHSTNMLLENHSSMVTCCTSYSQIITSSSKLCGIYKVRNLISCNIVLKVKKSAHACKHTGGVKGTAIVFSSGTDEGIAVYSVTKTVSIRHTNSV